MTPDGPADERALVDAARAGDRTAMDALLRAHQPMVHAICRRLTGNDADALDATQEALIAIVRGLPRFDGRARLSTWCYRVATNACLDELRRRTRRPLVGLPDDDRGDGPDRPTASTERPVADQVADRLAIDHALSQLPPEFAAPVVLRDLCQLDYAEIAAVLEIPAGTVRSRISRGRAQLADLLAGTSTPTSDVRASDHD